MAITPALQSVLQRQPAAAVNVVIQTAPDRIEEVKNRLRQQGISFREPPSPIPILEATVPSGFVMSLDASPGVVEIDHASAFTPLEVELPAMTADAQSSATVSFTVQDAAEVVKAPEAWDSLGHRGKGVRVGIVDTPVDQAHEAYRDRIVVSAGPTGADIHGTWVASAIAATAPESEIVTHGALSGGTATVGELSEGIQFCLDNDVDVINCSWGSGRHSSVMQNIMTEVVNQGVTPVVAIGNSGPGQGSAMCPGHHDEVLSVGSVSIRNGTVSRFSSRGPGFEKAKVPSVVAPGGDTGDDVTEAIVGAAPGNQYRGLLGTSMATPFVAGTVALTYIEVAERTPSLKEGG